MDVDKLRHNYMYTWQFPIDFLSLLPTDLLYLHFFISPVLTCTIKVPHQPGCSTFHIWLFPSLVNVIKLHYE